MLLGKVMPFCPAENVNHSSVSKHKVHLDSNGLAFAKIDTGASD